MLKIGITGGIGTGKTTICKIFETLGVPIYYADDRAKWIMHHNQTVVDSLKENFGGDIYMSNLMLDRIKLGNLVFNDKEKLNKLNSIVHPAVFQDGLDWEVIQLEKGVPYTLKEAALLFETKSNLFLDKIIVVTAPEELRVKRVMERDGFTEKEVLARISTQMPEEEKLEKADFVMVNDGVQALIPQVLDIHKKILLEL